MREIKFRAWGINSKEFLSPDGKVFGLTLKEIQNIEDISLWEFQQFTGLQDKNGKEIYEVDIVKDAWSNIIDIWEVYFDNENARFWVKNRQEILGENNCEDDPDYPNWRNYEVIGNIFENKELLTN